MVTIHLALSQRAAYALERTLTGKPAQPADPPILSDIVTELCEQLANAAVGGERTTRPIDTTPVARVVAEAMAAAGAESLNQKAA